MSGLSPATKTTLSRELVEQRVAVLEEQYTLHEVHSKVPKINFVKRPRGPFKTSPPSPGPRPEKLPGYQKGS
jgi:hypothetical protein